MDDMEADGGFAMMGDDGADPFADDQAGDPFGADAGAGTDPFADDAGTTEADPFAAGAEDAFGGDAVEAADPFAAASGGGGMMGGGPDDDSEAAATIMRCVHDENASQPRRPPLSTFSSKCAVAAAEPRPRLQSPPLTAPVHAHTSLPLSPSHPLLSQHSQGMGVQAQCGNGGEGGR